MKCVAFPWTRAESNEKFWKAFNKTNQSAFWACHNKKGLWQEDAKDLFNKICKRELTVDEILEHAYMQGETAT